MFRQTVKSVCRLHLVYGKYRTCRPRRILRINPNKGPKTLNRTRGAEEGGGPECGLAGSAPSLGQSGGRERKCDPHPLPCDRGACEGTGGRRGRGTGGTCDLRWPLGASHSGSSSGKLAWDAPERERPLEGRPSCPHPPPRTPNPSTVPPDHLPRGWHPNETLRGRP